MHRRGWDQLAKWRDFRMGEGGDLWHRAIIDPTLLEVVGPVRGLSVLDLACGNGYLTRRWAREGAMRSVGVEHSRPTLALARRRERANPTGAEFLDRDARKLSGFASGTFDLVVSNMALQDIRNARGAVREVARILRPDGRFVFSLSHPCFDLDDRSGWVVERVREPDGRWHDVVWRKVRAYRDERSVDVSWDISDRETGWTTGYHRTLTTYSRWLREAGLAITRLEEPSPLSEAIRSTPQGSYMLEVPLHLVVEARFLPSGAPRRGDRALTRPGSRSSAGNRPKESPRSGSGDRRRRSGSVRRGSTTGL